MRVLLLYLRITLNAARLLGGWFVYSLRGRTPAAAYQAFIRLFCLTGGRSNDYMSFIVRTFTTPTILPEKGILGSEFNAELPAAVRALQEEGFYVFEHRLPAQVCERLLDFALNHPCEVRVDDDGTRPTVAKRIYAADRLKPAGVRYDFSAQDLIDNSDVQALLADPALLAVAQEYFGTRPIADVIALWWTTAYSLNPSKEAAQFFHFDLDRPKWIKFFIHLTDVTPQTGPHSFVRGSHRTGGIPEALLAQGYSRLSDEEIKASYPRERIIEFSAPKGTILVEDTRGLHKGNAVKFGDRLLFQIQYSNSLFGASYDKVRISQIRSDAFREYAAREPAVYRSMIR